jgi:hypothetical protein
LSRLLVSLATFIVQPTDDAYFRPAAFLVAGFLVFTAAFFAGRDLAGLAFAFSGFATIADSLLLPAPI